MKQKLLHLCLLFVIGMTANISTYASNSADVNGDGVVDVADIASIISVMAGGNSVPLSPDTSPEGALAVDLGLPSGTKWANMNVGAVTPGGDGLFFSWGDVTGYSRLDNRNFSYSNYKWGTSKYNSTDGKIELDAEDDAARAHWGGQWAMPTNDEFYELMNNTTWKWELYDGAWGRTFTSKINGNSIFFPAQGYRDSQMNAYYLSGYYWSSSLYYFNPSKAVYFYFRSDADMYVSQLERYYGCAVRPVLRKANENENQLKNADVNGDNVVDVADISYIISVMAGSEPINRPPDVIAVDLDLPSGTKWANMNVGAEKAEEWGLFFAWGETKGYGCNTSDGRKFDWASYKWCNGSENTITKYSRGDTLALEDDAAHANWGGDWVMPTREEIDELVKNTTNKWTTQNGVNGWIFIGKNGNSIFLPASGYRAEANYYNQGGTGDYWSASLIFSESAYFLDFYSRIHYSGGYQRCLGLSVRPVQRFKPLPPPNVKAIDLGLPSGLKWANMNVGATSPQEPGLYFAWGDTKGYTSATDGEHKFDWASYKWMTEGQAESRYINKYQSVTSNAKYYDWYEYDFDTFEYVFNGDGKTTLDPEDDAAHVNWGDGWRMPTGDEIIELVNNTTCEKLTVGTVTGYKLTSKINGNAIFIPAADYSHRLSGSGNGEVWSSTLNTLWPSEAYALSINSGGASWDPVVTRSFGLNIRPVTDKK